MQSKNSNKGFTLAELLIVVAIIAVLTAIAIPVFLTQLHKSQDAADLANIRSYYAEIQSEALINGKTEGVDVPSSVEHGHSIEFKNGGSFKLNNLNITKIAVGDEKFAIKWDCKDGDNCKSENHSGIFGDESLIGN